MKASDLQPLTVIPLLCEVYGLPLPVEEFRFHPTRKWRFDLCWPAAKVALEIEGGVWTNGRHVRGTGYLNDIQKYNAAVLLGWKVFRTTPQTAHQVAELLKEALR